MLATVSVSPGYTVHPTNTIVVGSNLAPAHVMRAHGTHVCVQPLVATLMKAKWSLALVSKVNWSPGVPAVPLIQKQISIALAGSPAVGDVGRTSFAWTLPPVSAEVSLRVSPKPPPPSAGTATRE